MRNPIGPAWVSKVVAIETQEQIFTQRRHASDLNITQTFRKSFLDLQIIQSRIGDVSRHKDGGCSVNFTDAELEFDPVVAENHSQLML